MPTPPLPSVLIANRGEIAVRILATCARLGIRTIAVFSDADAGAPHVALADDAFRVGPAVARASYLDANAILDAARRSGAAAIHPGYGFLAENAEFASACEAAGLVWIGPSPAAMRALGDKAHARALAEREGVPLLAGYHGADQAPDRLAREAARLGFPVLIKATAGGGGRGMRVVGAADEFRAALDAARREALASFGDERVLLERYVRRPRHVEVQILADTHGHVLHLGERECSIQRRHQKLVEESPSPAVDAALRARLGEAAVRLVRAAGYSNAGTVEFLLDEAGDFTFLEVNARLQVEHPVTELVTGLDLVEWQLRIAAGETLPFEQDGVQLTGHAIEARLIAEDPLAGWLPSSGTVEELELPLGVRVDSGVLSGSAVPAEYDSLLAKIIAHGGDRAAALRALRAALRRVWVAGLRTNVDGLLAIVEAPAFVAGRLDTGFLEAHGIIEALADVPGEVLAAVSGYDVLSAAPGPDPWRGSAAWRIGRLEQPSGWVRGGREHRARVTADVDGPGAEVTVGDRRYRVEVIAAGPGGASGARGGLAGAVGRSVRMLVDGRVVLLEQRGPDRLIGELDGRSYRLTRAEALAVAGAMRREHGTAGTLTAPMPGRIVRIAVQPGEAVLPNQPLLVLEAMKMEHLIAAPHAGHVLRVPVRVGQQVQANAVLLELGDEPVE